MYYVRYMQYINSFAAYDTRGNKVAAPIPAFISAAFRLWDSRKTISGPSVNSMDMGYNYGNPPSVPVPTPTVIKKRESTRNSAYSRRMRSGEIVVAPCRFTTTTIKPTLGLMAGKPSYIGTVEMTETYGGSNIFESIGLRLSRHPATNVLYVKDPVKDLWYWFNIVYRFTDNIANISVSPPVIDWDLVLSQDYQQDPQLIQQATAKVYSLSVDLLTSLAEAPETVSFIYDALKSVAYAIVNYKKILKDLAALFVKNRKLILEALQKELTDIDQMRPGDRRQARKQNRLRAKARSKCARSLKREAHANISRLANAWLTFRYVIMPNYYLIKDIVEARKNLGKEFVREQVSKSETRPLPVIPGATVTGSLSTRHRAWCGVRLKVYSPLEGLLGVAQVNPFVTAWELVPLSFVVDWFVGVGDALTVLSPPSGLDNQANTYSFKTEDQLTISFPNGSSYEVNREDYRLFVNHTTDFVGLYSNVQINWKRMLDAGALLWSTSLRNRIRY